MSSWTVAVARTRIYSSLFSEEPNGVDNLKVALPRSQRHIYLSGEGC